MISRYKNPWYDRSKSQYGPEYYETDVRPIAHRGYFIYQRIKDQVWDVVKDGICITQRAGLNGAISHINEIIRE